MRRQVYRSALVFVGLLALFQVTFTVAVLGGAAYREYLRFYASAGAAVLQALGREVAAQDTGIVGPAFSMTIDRGCDAIQVSGFLIAAIIALPVPATRKAWGTLGGVVFLHVLNLVRVVSLYYTGVHFPAAFETAHVLVWQSLIIFLAMVTWVGWAYWATGGGVVTQGGSG